MKMLRYNNNPFMNKALRKSIITRSGLKNKFNKNSSAKNWNSYRGCSSDIASSYYFRPSKVMEHVTLRVSGGEFKTK